jgi:hypothetical protein
VSGIERDVRMLQDIADLLFTTETNGDTWRPAVEHGRTEDIFWDEDTSDYPAEKRFCCAVNTREGVEWAAGLVFVHYARSHAAAVSRALRDVTKRVRAIAALLPKQERARGEQLGRSHAP